MRVRRIYKDMLKSAADAEALVVREEQLKNVEAAKTKIDEVIASLSGSENEEVISKLNVVKLILLDLL